MIRVFTYALTEEQEKDLAAVIAKNLREIGFNTECEYETPQADAIAKLPSVSAIKVSQSFKRDA